MIETTYVVTTWHEDRFWNSTAASFIDDFQLATQYTCRDTAYEVATEYRGAKVIPYAHCRCHQFARVTTMILQGGFYHVAECEGCGARFTVPGENETARVFAERCLCDAILILERHKTMVAFTDMDAWYKLQSASDYLDAQLVSEYWE